jgi:hypothetical protein
VSDLDGRLISLLDIHTERYHGWLKPIRAEIEIDPSIADTFWSDPEFWGSIYQFVEQEIEEQNS